MPSLIAWRKTWIFCALMLPIFFSSKLLSRWTPALAKWTWMFWPTCSLVDSASPSECQMQPLSTKRQTKTLHSSSSSNHCSSHEQLPVVAAVTWQDSAGLNPGHQSPIICLHHQCHSSTRHVRVKAFRCLALSVAWKSPKKASRECEGAWRTQTNELSVRFGFVSRFFCYRIKYCTVLLVVVSIGPCK